MKRTLSLAVSLLLGTVITVTAQVPKLNSYPAASATIFLDFDGHTVNSVYWNGGVPFYATPYNFTAEQITTMFNMVAEDFRPFNLNITTDSTVYFAAPINRRQRIVITTNSSWYGSAGGVAYIGSFTWGLEIPGFVFSNLLNNNIKYVGEAISHETGHTLNLQHQSKYDAACNFLKEYNDGAGTGEISWAPIMGVGYYKNLTLWHKGSSSLGCTNIQDDIAIIAGTRNGFGFRSDDVADALNKSSSISLNGNSFQISGLVNNSSDVDIFKVVMPDYGRFTLQAMPYCINSSTLTAANIDSKVDLLKNDGTIIGTYNPSNQLVAFIDTNLNAGTYYVRMSSTGNAYTTNYGMLGSYSLIGTVATGATLPVYSLVLNGSVQQERHELQWNIIADEPIASITIQQAPDGRNFSDFTAVDVHTHRFSYLPENNQTIFYRLHVTTASDLHYYSNIVSLKSENTLQAVRINSNIFTHTIELVSNDTYLWRLTDMNGRLMQSGRLLNGSNRIAAADLQAGIYLLQVQQGNHLSTFKLIKR